MSSPTETQLPKLDNTLGAMYIGGMFVAALFGVTSIQSIQYFNRFPNDKPVLKLTVSFLWFLDLLHLIINSHTFYHYAITNYANPKALQLIVWSLGTGVFVTNISDFMVRGFFAFRIWKLSKGNRVLVGSVVLTVVAVIVIGFSYGINCSKTKLYTDLETLPRAITLLYLSLGSSAFSDVLIAVALCILLRQHQMVSHQTESLVRVILIYTINASVLTSLCALASLIAFAVMPKNFIFIAIYSLLPKLYLNSLLATLNARHSLRNQMKGTALSIPLSTIELRSHGTAEQGQGGMIDIRVGTTIERFEDSQRLDSQDLKVKS